MQLPKSRRRQKLREKRCQYPGCGKAMLGAEKGEAKLILSAVEEFARVDGELGLQHSLLADEGSKLRRVERTVQQSQEEYLGWRETAQEVKVRESCQGKRSRGVIAACGAQDSAAHLGETFYLCER